MLYCLSWIYISFLQLCNSRLNHLILYKINDHILNCVCSKMSMHIYYTQAILYIKSSYNCHGFRGSIPFLNDIVLKSDILCLHELMISKQDCHILNSCHHDYTGHAVSTYDASSGVLLGRPYGGVGFMWKNSFDESIGLLLKETRVCVCLPNWTNFCPYGLNSTPSST